MKKLIYILGCLRMSTFSAIIIIFLGNYYFNGNIPQKTYSHQDKSRIEIQASKVAFDL